MPFRIGLAVITLTICGCAAAPDIGRCESDRYAVDARYDGGDLNGCKFLSEDQVELTFLQEDDTVDSAFAWYSFRVSAKERGKLAMTLRFPTAYARFWPKLSTDGRIWERAAESAVAIADDGKSMQLEIEIGESGVWVSAQELLTQDYYDQWLTELHAHEEIVTSIIGWSVEGRPIHLARSSNKPEFVVLIGRQHPVEVPGALAMRQFVDVVLDDSQLAREFRERYALLIIPLVNPDGVANGHARHNAGRTDLNRDWGPFTQPETQSIAKLLAEALGVGMQPRLMLDFHATKMTPTMVFYTQVPEDNTNPPLFATTWLTRVGERITDYSFKHDPRPPSGLDNAKNYFFSRYGIPAITYEIGDEADRDKVQALTPIFAEEMMRTLLEAK